MSLRLRFALSVAIVAALATLVGSSLSYQATASRLDRAVDESLQSVGQRQAQAMLERGVNLDRPGRGRGRRGTPQVQLGGEPDGDQRPDRQSPGDELLAVQWIDRTGTVRQVSAVEFPVSTLDKSIAAGAAELRSHVSTRTVEGVTYRVRTLFVPQEGAVQVGRDISENRSVLNDLLQRFALLVFATSVGAAFVGWLLARSATKRLVTLEGVVTEMASSGDLSMGATLDVTGKDETALVSIAFAKLTAALRTSRDQQLRLVQDASHELRTPLTSLRTNLAVLPQLDRLSAHDRSALVADMQAEVEELVELVEDLVVQATTATSDEQPERLALGDIAAQCVASIRRRSGRTVNFSSDDSVVLVGATSAQRAITNLLANAVKFDSTNLPIEVVVRNCGITVLDNGPGFVEHDLPRVFDRFYRADSSRTLPGSGLGLSIVAEVAARFGGTASAENRKTGGAQVTLQFCSSPVEQKQEYV